MKAIVAVDDNWAIGYRNRLLFHVPEDLAHFKNATMGHPVVMGRKTLESLPGGKPLPGRTNYVLSADPAFQGPDGVVVCPHVDALLRIVPPDAYVIGGASVYRQLLPFCDEVVVTRIPEKAESADTWFPDMNHLDEWTVGHVEVLHTDRYGNGAKITTYVKLPKAGPKSLISVRHAWEPEYQRLERLAGELTAESPDGVSFSVEDIWFDFGQRWAWTTVVMHDSRKIFGTAQMLSPADMHDIIDDDAVAIREIKQRILGNIS